LNNVFTNGNDLTVKQGDRIGSYRRASGKDTCQRILLISPGMHPEDISFLFRIVFMKPDKDDYVGELLEEVVELADEHDWFDTEFVDSVSEQFESRGYLTEKQISALQNIRDMLLRA